MQVSARPLPLPARAAAAAAAPAARKPSDTVATVGKALQTTSLIALGLGFLVSMFVPAAARITNIVMAAGGAGVLASMGLGWYLDKLKAEGK
jgi:hypothetical protein